MTHADVFRHFKEILPHLLGENVTYFPHGKNAIRVRCDDKKASFKET